MGGGKVKSTSDGRAGLGSKHNDCEVGPWRSAELLGSQGKKGKSNQRKAPLFQREGFGMCFTGVIIQAWRGRWSEDEAAHTPPGVLAQS